MRSRTRVATLCCLFVLMALPALAQNLPQECRDAMDARSPQAQIDLFTACLNTGQLAADERATTYKQRAIAYMHLGQHQRAVDDTNMAIKTRPSDADNYYLRSVAQRALGRLREAVEDSSKAISMDANFAAAYANRAFAHKALGNESMAKSDTRRALELDPRVKVPSF